MIRRLIQRIKDWWLEQQINDLRLHAFELYRRKQHDQANFFWHQAMDLELKRSPQQLARMEVSEESGA